MFKTQQQQPQYPRQQLPQAPPIYIDERVPLVRGPTQRTVNVVFWTYERPDFCCLRLITYVAMFIFFFIMGYLFIGLIREEMKEETYTYYLLTTRWPPAECENSHKCVNLTSYKHWLIHGLWPEFSNNTWNQFCRKDTFNISKIQPIETEMKREWPNLLHGETEESLWSHEWLKHGTCSPLDEYDYFSKTLDLFRRYSIDQYLSTANIRPNNATKYSLSQFRRAISPLISTDSVSFSCIKHEHRSLINEIMFCFMLDKVTETFSPTRCTMETNCDEHILYID